MSEQFALIPPDEPDPDQPVRVLDAAEADATECRTCGAPAQFRVYRPGGPRDYCEGCLPQPYGAIPY